VFCVAWVMSLSNKHTSIDSFISWRWKLAWGTFWELKKLECPLKVFKECILLCISTIYWILFPSNTTMYQLTYTHVNERNWVYWWYNFVTISLHVSVHGTIFRRYID
jgi:hypothetical protein